MTKAVAWRFPHGRWNGFYSTNARARAWKYYYPCTIPTLPTLSLPPCRNKESVELEIYIYIYTERVTHVEKERRIRIEAVVGAATCLNLVNKPVRMFPPRATSTTSPRWISFSLWRLARHLASHDPHLLCPAHCPARPLKSPRLFLLFFSFRERKGGGGRLEEERTARISREECPVTCLMPISHPSSPLSIPFRIPNPVIFAHARSDPTGTEKSRFFQTLSFPRCIFG